MKIGFIPALVSAYLMLQVGEKRARDLLLTGRLFSAEEALALGLASEVVPGSDLQARTQTLAETLMANSPQSLRATKALLAEQNRLWLEHALESAVSANARGREGAAFRKVCRLSWKSANPTGAPELDCGGVADPSTIGGPSRGMLPLRCGKYHV